MERWVADPLAVVQELAGERNATSSIVLLFYCHHLDSGRCVREVFEQQLTTSESSILKVGCSNKHTILPLHNLLNL